MGWWQKGMCTLGVLLGAALGAAPAGGETAGPWSMVVFGGRATNGGFEEVPPNGAHFVDAYMLGLSLNRRLSRQPHRWAWEAEGQLVKHFGEQHHAEANLALVLRWLPFPWDHTLDTSIAVGEGISAASSVPEIETQRSPNTTARFLNYVMVEVDLRPPQSVWSVVFRLHHRSGVVGLYNGVHKGSNVYAAGIRRQF